PSALALPLLHSHSTVTPAPVVGFSRTAIPIPDSPDTTPSASSTCVTKLSPSRVRLLRVDSALRSQYDQNATTRSASSGTVTVVEPLLPLASICEAVPVRVGICGE